METVVTIVVFHINKHHNYEETISYWQSIHVT